jgi:small subunit ribosomal protein S4
MGDIKRKRRLYTKPRKLFDRTRIDEENVLVKKYGLKNKKEIWKAKSLVSKLRKRAKNLINSTEEQKKFIEKLNGMGISVKNFADILALKEDDILNRRLQTFVLKKKIANSPREARQLIVHKHVIVGGNIVNIPSFWITKELENKIEFKPFKEKENKKTKSDEIKNGEDE